MGYYLYLDVSIEEIAMSVKYHVRLDSSEREMLEALIKQEKPVVAQHKKRHAQILLAIDENNAPLTHEQAAKAFNVKPLM
ncbi:hypothetical protein ACH42_14425 [Endozoicomonas sp. (ex Bugula neritina AB1)]|nr:hypothetical protein ACH42_14425 [Endozoicomonas sp. (ex Bugula neritina AB1)]